MAPIYLDYNATTPVDPAVLDAMLPFLREHFGNPSSAHAFGKAAHDAVDAARVRVAALFGAQADEIVFTGGGSEASNHAIKGACFANGVRPDAVHVITTAVEHPATAKPVEFLRSLGAEVTVLPVDRFGLLDPDAVRRAITPRTRLVSVMHSNNEVGTLMPVREVAAVCRGRGVLVHTDCAQSLGKVRVDVTELGVDLLTVAGHKLYAPKGVGALFVRRGVKLEPLIHGAGHERGRRAGTENVPYIVGLGKACEIAARSLQAPTPHPPESKTTPATSPAGGEVKKGAASLPCAEGSLVFTSPPAGEVAALSSAAGGGGAITETERLRSLRDRLHAKLLAALGERVVLNGHPEARLPNTLSVNFVGHVGAELLAKALGVAASTGSACHAGQVTLSPVLAAMGVPPEVGRGAVRLSAGRFTTEDEVDRAAEMLAAAAK